MRLRLSQAFLEMLAGVPLHVQKAFFKQAKFLEQNLRHPSLHAKKYDEARDVWQARVTGDWRFYFTIEGGGCRLHVIRKHPR